MQCQGRMRRIFYCQREKEEYFLSVIVLQSREIMSYASGKKEFCLRLLVSIRWKSHRSFQYLLFSFYYREDSKVSHYIINKMSQGDQARYRIGDQMFNDLPALLNFYKVFQTIHIRCLPWEKWNLRICASLFVCFHQIFRFTISTQRHWFGRHKRG